MEIVRDFNIIVDKVSVLAAVASYYELSIYEQVDEIYFQLEQLALQTIKPSGCFTIDVMSDDLSTDILKNCEFLVYCIFTIGDEISEIIEDLFAKNEFDKAIILDAISTSILFNLSKQLCDKVFLYAKERKLGLTCRIAPGDGEIDIGYQQDIVLKFIDNKNLDFDIINGYMIKPYKTLTYLYGADSRIEINKEDHNCEKCLNTNCFMRNSSKKIRGPFTTRVFRNGFI